MPKNFLAASIGLLFVGSASAATFSTNPASTGTIYEHPAPLGNFALTQSGSLTITPGSVSCNSASIHRENSYYRRLDLDTHFSATGTVTISSVDFGIEAATGAGGTQPVTVNLYAIPNASTLTLANLGAPIATQAVAVVDADAGTLKNVAIPASLNGLTHDLVVEILTPDGQPSGHSFFIGSNATASINPAGAPSFLRAPICGVNEPTATSAIGFPNMNIIIVANALSLPVSLQSFGID